MDRIYLRYKIRIVELMEATKKYDLDQDPDIVAIKNANLAWMKNF